VQIFPSFNAGKTMSQWGPKSQVGRLVLKANKSWKPPTNDGLHVMVSNSHKVHGIMSNSLGPNKKGQTISKVTWNLLGESSMDGLPKSISGVFHYISTNRYAATVVSTLPNGSTTTSCNF
jgi:hypothetical protein